MVNPIPEFEAEFAEYIGTKHAIMVNSGSSALLTVLSYCKEVLEKRNVITTAYTFPATSNMIIHAGLKPIFVDIEPRRPLIDTVQVEKALNNTFNKCVILPVHLFGEACNMSELMRISETYEVPIIEDTSQSLGASYKGQRLGSFGLAGTFSFYHSKNLPTFEGGMITTSNQDLVKYCRKYINHGLNERGEMEILGYNLKPAQILAFIGEQHLRLHKPGIEAELGRYGPMDGYYSRLVYENPWYQENLVKWSALSCENAKKLAAKVRSELS